MIVFKNYIIQLFLKIVAKIKQIKFEQIQLYCKIKKTYIHIVDFKFRNFDDDLIKIFKTLKINKTFKDFFLLFK